MFDKHQNFLLQGQILDVVKNYLKVSVGLTKEAEFYLNSIVGKNNEVCVFTENNHAVILHPNYADIVPYGFIKLFSADIYHHGELIGRRDYPAFECNKNITDSEEAIMFIIDGKNVNILIILYNVNLYVIDIFSRKNKLEFSKQKFYQVKNLKNIPTSYKQIFFMIYKIDYTECPDRSRLHLSNDNITYDVKAYQNVYISSMVKFSDMSKFKEMFSLEERTIECIKILERHPYRIPVIMEPTSRTLMPAFEQSKFLVPFDFTISNIIDIIRKREKISDSQAIFVYINRIHPSMCETIKSLYERHGDEDGFLYIEFSSEDSYGFEDNFFLKLVSDITHY